MNLDRMRLSFNTGNMTGSIADKLAAIHGVGFGGTTMWPADFFVHFEDLDANLVDCDTLLLVYGKADAPWVRAQLRRYSKIERLRDLPPRIKTILFAPPAPKPEIAMSGGFAKIDCESGLTGDSVEQIVAELRR